MNNDNGKLNFSIGIDTSQLRQDAEKSRELLAGIGREAVQQGSVLDKALGESGAARGFNALEAAISAAGKQISDMDFGTAEEKIGALSHIIARNESVIADNVAQLEKWRQDAQEAFASGDTATLETLTKDIDDQISKIQELSQETEDYRNTLSAVMSVSGLGSQDANVPRLFDSAEDIAALEELKKKIIETQAEIQRVGASGGDTSQLTVELSELRDKLNETEQGAAQAAAALGEDLGGRAAEAQQNLYQLNTAVADQQAVVDKLAAALEEARAKYEELQGSNDTTAEQLEMAAATYDTLSESLSNAQQQLIGLQAAQQTAQGQWQAVSQEVQQHDSVMVKMLGGYENYQAIVQKLPQPVQMAIQGIQGMTGAAKAFIATPIGAIIAAVVLALQAMKTWLNSTVEGQLKFAEITGFVSGILGQLKEIVITVGKALFKAFSDPKQAISDLWEAIKTNVVNRFKAVGDIAASLGKVIKAAFTFDGDGIKQGLKELGESFVQLGTGVDNLAGKVGNWAKGVKDAATETANIRRETRELEIQESEWQKRNQELEQGKAKARGKMYNSSLSASERKKAMDEYKLILDEQIEMEAKFADKKIELQQRTMALTSNTIEDENKLRELQAARLAVDTKKAQELASLERREGMILNKGQSEDNAAAKEAEARAKALVSLGDLEAELLIRNQETQLAIMAEGHDKRMEEIKLSKTKEMDKLQELQDKFVSLNKAAGAQTGEDGLTDSQRDHLIEARLNTERKYQQAVKGILESELADIMTYEQKRLAVKEQYAEREAALYTTDSDGNKTLKEGVTQGNLANLKDQEEEALAAVDAQFAAREDTFEAWCNEIASLSLEELKQRLKEAEEALKEAENNGTSGTQLATARAKVNKAQQAVSKASAKQETTSPSKRSLKEWEDLYKVLNECNGAIAEIGDTVGGTAGEIINAAGQIATSTLTMINGIVQLVTMSAAGMQATAGTAAAAISTVEKASVILTVISAALQVAMAIANLFNNDEERQKEIEALQGRIDTLQWELDNADIVKLREGGINTLGMMRESLESVTAELLRQRAVMGDLDGVKKLVFGGAVNDTEALNKITTQLSAAYGNVAYSANKALGADKYKSAKDNLNKIAEQQLLIQEQINKEGDKKKSDSDKIKEWEQQIEELGSQAIEMINGLVEDIIGGTSSDIANELADAFFEAFEAGEDAAEAWGDKVNDIVGDILKRMMIQQFLEEPLGRIFDKYKQRWFKDGDFQGIDAVTNSLTGFASDLQAVGSDFADIWNALPDEVRNIINGTQEASREASQGEGIATASQESVDELNGRMTAVQGHTYSINESMKQLTGTTALILQSVINIEGNTDRMDNRMAHIESDMSQVKNTVSDLALKGIKIK